MTNISDWMAENECRLMSAVMAGQSEMQDAYGNQVKISKVSVPKEAMFFGCDLRI